MANSSEIETLASSMANQGYIITAVGYYNGKSEFVLVGCRIQGDSLPRPLAFNVGYEKGYAVVGAFFDENGNTFIGEE